MFAAINTIGPLIVDRNRKILEKGQPRYEVRRLQYECVHEHLRKLATCLDDPKWRVDDCFSAADFQIVFVLQWLEESNVPDGSHLLDNY